MNAELSRVIKSLLDGRPQSWLAESTGMSVGTVSEILSSKRECKHDHLALFIKAFAPNKEAQDRLVLAHLMDEIQAAGISPLRFNLRRSVEVVAFEEPDEPIYADAFKDLRQLLLIEAGENEKARAFTQAFVGLHKVCEELLARRRDDHERAA
jgi:hypothetical protein